MPTKNPRLLLTIPPDLMALLREFAEVAGKPVATVVVQLLKEAQPQLVDLMRIAKLEREGKRIAAKRALVRMVGQGMADILTSEQLPLKGIKR